MRRDYIGVPEATAASIDVIDDAAQSAPPLPPRKGAHAPPLPPRNRVDRTAPVYDDVVIIAADQDVDLYDDVLNVAPPKATPPALPPKPVLPKKPNVAPKPRQAE